MRVELLSRCRHFKEGRLAATWEFPFARGACTIDKASGVPDASSALFAGFFWRKRKT